MALAAGALALLAQEGASAQTADDAESAPIEAREVNFLGLPADPFDGPISTDRPDFTETPTCVPRGRTQLEFGYTYALDDQPGGASQTHTLPEALVRYGLFRGVEARIAWEGWSHAEGADASGWGVSDLGLGLKFALLEQRGLVPTFGVIIAAAIPTGSDAESSGDVDPELKLLWSYDVCERATVSGNVNFGGPTEDGRRFFQSAVSVSLGMELAEWLGGYVEYVGVFPGAIDGGDAHTLNGGLTFPVTDNMQFDVRAGFGLSDQADDFFTGVGFAIRF